MSYLNLLWAVSGDKKEGVFNEKDDCDGENDADLK